MKAAPQLDGSSTVIGRAALPKDRMGEGTQEKEPILFPTEKRLQLTAVSRKAGARAHII